MKKPQHQAVDTTHKKQKSNSSRSRSRQSESMSRSKSKRRLVAPTPEKYYCIFPGNGYKLIRDAMAKKEGWTEVKKEDVWSTVNQGRLNFVWKPTNFNYKMWCNIDNILHRSQMLYQKEKGLDRELVVNHLENHRELTTKTGLIRCLKYFYKDNVDFIEHGYTVFDTTPTSFVVSSKLETYETHQFNKRFDDLAKENFHPLKEKMPEEQCRNNTWLVKPANENQGKGIKIFSDKDQIHRFLEQSMTFSYWVIQKYLERPLLYKGRKFDIRVWGFAQSNLDFYFYDVGYLRTSSQGYNLDNMDDEFTHLTNNCLQIKNKETYGQHEEGNTISFEQFQEYLDAEFPQHNLDLHRDFVQRMKDIAIDCYLSAKNTLNPNKRRNSFEFFGFDFMIDEDFRVWLIEVNTNPYIGIHNTGMKHIIPDMFEDLFKIVLDPVYASAVLRSDIDLIGTDTKFDLLYSRMRGVNKRRDPLEGMYPIKTLDKRKNYSKPMRRARKQNSEIATNRKPTQPKPNELAASPEMKHTYSKRPEPKSPAQFVSESQTKGEQLELQTRDSQADVETQIEKQISPVKKDQAQEKLKVMANTSLSIFNSFRLQKKPTESKAAFSSNTQLLTVQAVQSNSLNFEDSFLSRKPSVPKVVELKMQKLKPSKSITEHVKRLDKSSAYIKQQVQEVLNRILATVKSWELFSAEQLSDANQALRMLLSGMPCTSEEHMCILTSLSQLVGSNEVPIYFRTQAAANLLLMFKNKGFVKYFLSDEDAFASIEPLYQVLQEKSLNETYTSLLDELQSTSAQIMVQLMSLNNRKYYIPGETSEKAKMRQQAMDLGILAVMAHVQLSSADNSQLQQYIHDEFVDRIEESDIEYHFLNNHSHYEKVASIIETSHQKQLIDESLDKRLAVLKECREREQKIQAERRKDQEHKEQQLKIENEYALQEKRILAEKRMQQRIRELARQKNLEIKQQTQMKEDMERESQIRKIQTLEEQRKKQELRRQAQTSILKKKQEEEQEVEEQLQRDRLQRVEQRKVEMEEWHRRKRAEEKRKTNFSVSKVMNRKCSSFSNQHAKDIDEIQASQMAAIAMRNFQQKKRSVEQEHFLIATSKDKTKSKYDDIIEESNRKAIEQLRKLQQQSQGLSLQTINYQAHSYSANQSEILESGMRISNVEKSKFGRTLKKQELNHTQTEIATQNDFVPTVPHLRGRAGATAVNSPPYEQRFKKKNDSIIKKGDRLIQESNEFISNLKRRALVGQESKSKTLEHQQELTQQLLKPGLPSLINHQPSFDGSPHPYLNTNLENDEKQSPKKEQKKKIQLNNKHSGETVDKTEKVDKYEMETQMQRQIQIQAEAGSNDQYQKLRMSSSQLSNLKHQKMIHIGGLHAEGYFSHKHNASVGQISELASIEIIKPTDHETKTSNQGLNAQNIEEKLKSGVKMHLDTEGMELDDRFLREERQNSQEQLRDSQYYQIDLRKLDPNQSTLYKNSKVNEGLPAHQQLSAHEANHISKHTLPRIEEFTKYKTEHKLNTDGQSNTTTSFKSQNAQYRMKYPSAVPEDTTQQSAARYRREEFMATQQQNQARQGTRLVPLKSSGLDFGQNSQMPEVPSSNQEASEGAGARSPGTGPGAAMTIINNDFSSINFSANINVQNYYSCKEPAAGGAKRKKKKRSAAQAQSQAQTPAQAAQQIYASQLDPHNTLVTGPATGRMAAKRGGSDIARLAEVAQRDLKFGQARVAERTKKILRQLKERQKSINNE